MNEGMRTKKGHESPHKILPELGATSSGLPAIPPLEIGELGSKWNFPSDHIPVAGEVANIRIGSWNILNSKWIHFFNENREGLAASAILSEDVPLYENGKWTKREEHTLQIVLSLLGKLDLIVLQECSNPFIRALSSNLPDNWSLLRATNGDPENDIIALYNQNKLYLDTDRSEFLGCAYACKAGKGIMNMHFTSHAGTGMRVIHTHVPGDPKMPGLAELAAYLDKNKEAILTVVAGDLNFTEDRVASAFILAGLPPFHNLVSVNTVVATDKIAKSIDHILVFNEGIACANSITHSELSKEIEGVSTLINPPV